MRQSVLAVFFVLISLFSAVSMGSDEGPWSFIIVGDSRSGGSHNGVNVRILTEIADEIVRQKVDFVVFPGDLVVGAGSEKKLEVQLMTWREVMQPVYDAQIAVYPVRGNHDLGGSKGTEVWHRIFSGPYALPQNGPAGEKGLTYAVEHKNVLLVGLDQYVNPNRVNQGWLEAQFAANDKAHTFVFGHVPAFGLEHKDCLDDHPEARDAFWESLKRAGVRVYACGHDHFFDHALVDDGDGNRQNDIHQYVVGTAGAPLKKWSPPYKGPNGDKMIEQQQHHRGYGYVLVEVVSDTEYRMRWYGRDKAGQYAPSEKANVVSREGAALAGHVPASK